MGLINDPDTVAADKPDQYGLMLDRMKEGTLTWDPETFGYSSGVIGLQLFVNKKFDPQKWSLAKYLENPASVEPPYNVGMACGFCHVSFNPVRPPADVHEPKWDNIVSNIGNQYFREGMLFASDAPRNSFIYQYLSTQEPGTSETSRFSNDFINGPIQISAIYRVPARAETCAPRKDHPRPTRAYWNRCIGMRVSSRTTPAGRWVAPLRSRRSARRTCWRTAPTRWGW